MTMALFQLTKKELFGNSIIRHSRHVTSPAKLAFHDKRFNATDVKTRSHFCVGYIVSPLDSTYAAKTSQMKTLQTFEVTTKKGP